MIPCHKVSLHFKQKKQKKKPVLLLMAPLLEISSQMEMTCLGPFILFFTFLSSGGTAIPKVVLYRFM